MADLHSAATATRARQGELLSAVSAVLLAVVMFALEWYGVAGVPGHSRLTSSENAWHALTVIRWLMLLTILVALTALPLHASQDSHGARTNTAWAVMLLGGATAALLVYRALIQLPSGERVVDQKLGSILGILCAVSIAYGGWEAIQAERELSAGPDDGSRSQVTPPTTDVQRAARRRTRLARNRN